ncbi:MAG: hypothetical protein ACREJ5_27070, partial [Geminicoccaceae bacterium]
MASASFDTHAFIKRLTAAGMPEVLAEESTRLVGEQVATKQDVALLRADIELLRADVTAMEQRIKDQLTIRIGAMLAGGIAIVAALAHFSISSHQPAPPPNRPKGTIGGWLGGGAGRG